MLLSGMRLISVTKEHAGKKVTLPAKAYSDILAAANTVTKGLKKDLGVPIRHAVINHGVGMWAQQRQNRTASAE